MCCAFIFTYMFCHSAVPRVSTFRESPLILTSEARVLNPKLCMVSRAKGCSPCGECWGSNPTKFFLNLWKNKMFSPKPGNFKSCQIYMKDIEYTKMNKKSFCSFLPSLFFDICFFLYSILVIQNWSIFNEFWAQNCQCNRRKVLLYFYMQEVWTWRCYNF